ncbi:MAG: HNH endonuclease [Planctomycetes bacterium]|nr:HNH endonuclease [Planctomycetota bacterium]
MNARAIRRFVQARAGFRCEYCHIDEDDDPYTFHLEHIIPRKHHGRNDRDNLAWSCHTCNLAKGSNLSGRVDDEVVTLFDPRRQNWNRHFRWRGPVLVGKTKCGRATVQVLNINAEDRIKVRALLIAAGQNMM